MISVERSLAEDDLPVLRIETGEHLADIWHVSADAAGDIALTVSQDKTARVWEVSSGRLIRVLRVPIGEGHEGQLYSGTLSPDGRLAAVGGFTGRFNSHDVSVYFFDLITGELVRQISGLEQVALNMAFSPDGRYLAAVFAEFGHYDQGLKVWESATGRLVGSDNSYDGSSYGIDWFGNDRLVTACFDGLLRLYALKEGTPGPELQLIKKRLAKAGYTPYSVRFSPDGTKIAVGCYDAPWTAVMDGNDLSFLFETDNTGLIYGGFRSVAWIQDGDILAAGGQSRGLNGSSSIRLWPQAGRGKPIDKSPVKGEIMDLYPLPKGRLLFCASDVTWGVVSKDGSIQTLGSAPIAHYNRDTCDVSASGENVGFEFQHNVKSPIQFSVSRGIYSTDPKSFESNHGARTSGLDVKGWQDKSEPTLKGVSLPLLTGEESRSLAIADDASFFLLGTDWYLRCFDILAAQRWQIDAPGTALAVNLCNQDKLAVSAYGDGTIRWYRAKDGKELLAFFPHADQKHWVLWTPEGYYDCSAGGEDLIGWHINRGRDHGADFFPASKFREQFYRPDVIQRVLLTRDVNQALADANTERGRQESQNAPKIDEVINRMQPPKVELVTGGTRGEVTLKPGAKDFTVQYRVVRGSGQPVERVLVYIDGRPVDDAKAEIPASDTAEGSATTSVPEHDCILTVFAKNRFAFSDSATLRLKRAPGDLNTSLKPKVYLLAAGISRYANNDQLPNLHFADKDARDFAAAFERQAQAGGLYQKVEAKVLTNEEATAKNILDGLDWIQHETTGQDVAIIFLSGHGENDQLLRFFFCPHDFDKKHPSSTGVSYAQISESVRAIAGKLLFFIDACHAGNALGDLVLAKGDARVDMTKVINELSGDENGAIVFASTTGTQLSQELEREHNGAFTKALVEGLDGQADLLHEGVITVASLETYVDARVKDLTDGSQKPTMARPSTIPNYPIAVK